ncbi:methionine adenosyltransferase [bacterium]|nr:methionine adenosyltransferase [bacterium]MCI0566123.1 methionine adenosyltransferase [bacterium]MCI0680334.1 methionine adenosyltransferase [bacterium]
MLYAPKIYTVESVTAGHPDKVCDQVSDAILDACLAEDPYSRVAVESFGSHGVFFIGGEVKTKAEPDYAKIARDVYRDIGYTNGDALKMSVHIMEQSPDIAQGVDTGGAGDQGIMYGYATDETKEFLPKGVVLAHRLTRGLQDLRTSGKLAWLRPDGKAQVTIEGDQVRAVLVSTQHAEDVAQEEIRSALIRELITPVLEGHVEGVEILTNPTGRFVQGGFEADAGLTGRKIMVDTYGGLAPHGGGAFSGKDPTKVDRSAAYAARQAAKSIVAGGYAKRSLVSVSYAIGRAEPLMVEAIDEKGESLPAALLSQFDFTPKGIIERLNLLRPIYRETASYGHFGNPSYPWEQTAAISLST